MPTKTNQLNLNTILIVAVIAGFFWFQGKKTDDGTSPAPKPVVVSITKAYDEGVKADRLAKIALLKEIATKSFSSDAEKMKWHNEEVARRREEAFRPYIDIIKDAMYDGTTQQLAEQWEAGK